LIKSHPRWIDYVWRTIYRAGFPLARCWWRLIQSTHEGALVAVYAGPDLLLLRSSYRREWGFPGGGVGPGETPEAAARRELAEETGLIAETLQPAGDHAGIWDDRRDHVYFFELRLDFVPDLKLDGREITAARFTPAADLSGLALTGPVAAFLSGTVKRSV